MLGQLHKVDKRNAYSVTLSFQSMHFLKFGRNNYTSQPLIYVKKTPPDIFTTNFLRVLLDFQFKQNMFAMNSIQKF